MLRDSSPRVRLMAGIACGKLKSTNALTALEELIVSTENNTLAPEHLA